MNYACATSGLQTGDAAIVVGPALYWGCVLVGTTNASTIALYDNASAGTGTVIDKISIDAGTALVERSHLLHQPVVCANGIYGDVTGTGANYIVYYEKINS